MFGVGGAIKRRVKVVLNFIQSPSATVCLLIKDEGRYLPEWLAHYLTLGFDRIVIYDNGSGAETRRIEHACAAADARISVFDWPDRPGVNPQVSAYSHAFENCETKWIAFFDTDEFLVLKKRRSIRSFLKGAKPTVGAIAVNWIFFGSNGETSYRPEPVTERFPRCAEVGNLTFKSIVRVNGAVGMTHPHSATLKDGFKYADADGSETALADVARLPYATLGSAQLNHYVLRSVEEYAWKRQRGSSILPNDHPRKFSKFADSDHFWKTHDHNARIDICVVPWARRAARLRRRFEALVRETKTIPQRQAVASISHVLEGPTVSPR
jgi:hypothetical protein